jgi:hypothetical protein
VTTHRGGRASCHRVNKPTAEAAAGGPIVPFVRRLDHRVNELTGGQFSEPSARRWFVGWIAW